MSARFFYGIAFGFASGILCRSFFTIDFVSLGAILVVTVVAFVYWWVNERTSASPLLLVVAVCIAFILGSMRLDFTLSDTPHQVVSFVGSDVELVGVVDAEVDERARTAHITVNVEMIENRTVDTVVLAITDRLVEVSYGDRVRVAGVLERPESFETDLGRTFNYPGYLAVRDIHYTMLFADVERIESRQGNFYIAALLNFKHAFMKNIERLLPEPQAGLGEGITLGAKRALGAELEAAFRATGIIHIVVLSGYNMTIVAEAVMRLLTVFFLPRTRFVIGVTTIISFAVLVGLSATVVRASIMALLVLVARLTGRTYAILRALVFSALIMLLINPHLLVFDPGFQLSFLATFGLILFAPIIEARLQLVPSRLQIREFVTATIATQLFVLPLLLYSIGELSVVAVPVNVLVLVVVPAAMLLVFLTGMFGFISSLLALPFAYGAHLLLSYIILVVELAAALPHASVIVPSFSFWWMVFGYAVLGGLTLWYWRKQKSPYSDLLQ